MILSHGGGARERAIALLANKWIFASTGTRYVLDVRTIRGDGIVSSVAHMLSFPKDATATSS